MPTPNYPEDGIPRLKGIPLVAPALSSPSYFGPRLRVGPSFGNIFFVDSGHSLRANDTANGRSPDLPFSSIDFAVGQCTANNGDIIYVMPGHVETVSAAAGLDLDVAGITLIGLGTGSSRPTVNFTTVTGADMDVDAANITIVNFLFTGGFDALTNPIDVNSDDFALIDCEYRDVTGQATDVIVAVSADRMLIDGYKHDGATVAGANSAIALDDCNDFTLCNFDLDGDFAVGAVDFRTVLSADVKIYNGRIRTRNSADIAIVDTITSSTGFIGPNLHIRVADNGPNITEAVTGATFVYIGGGVAAAAEASSGSGIEVVNLAGEASIAINKVQSTDA